MLQILHKPSGAEVDCPDPLHCPHLCLFLLALPAFLQLRQLLCLLLRSERLLRGLRDLQLLESLLRISRRRGQHLTGDQGPAHQVQLLLLHVLPGGPQLQHRDPEVLQAGNSPVLLHQADHVADRDHPPGVRSVSRR